MTSNKQIESPNFRIWLASRFFSNFGKQLQELVVFWQVHQLTKDPMNLGLIGLAQAIPFIAIALWAGHLVDQHEKKRILVLSETGHLLATFGLLATTWMTHPPLHYIYLCMGIVGFCSSFENISASAYAQTIIPKEDFPKAAAYNLSFFQGAVIGGPIVAGLLLHQFTPRVAYALATTCILLSFLLASVLKKVHVQPPPAPIEKETDWARVKSGLKFIRSQPLILSAMSLDMVAVLFGDCVALFPIFADRLGVGPTGLGLLRAAPPIGSLLLSTVQSFRPFVRASWGWLRTVVTLFGLCMIGFALSTHMTSALSFLIIGGMADAVSVIVRQSIYQALTPDHLRGRVSSVSLIFISSSNEIGTFESGFTAHFMGVVPSVLFGGSMTLFSVLGMTWVFRHMKKTSLDESQKELAT